MVDHGANGYVPHAALTTGRSSDREVAQAIGFGLAIGACFAFGLALAWKSPRIGGHGPWVQIEEAINPNTAVGASLVRLPGIGPARAAAIIAYRDGFVARGAETAAFSCPDDLQRVKGIGPATLEEIRPWLRFKSSSSQDATVRERRR